MSDYLKSFKQNLMVKRHRSAVFLRGDFAWACQWLKDNVALDLSSFDLIFSNQLSLSNVVNYKTYRHHLGTENDNIFFADGGFNVDAFAALTGTLMAGGICYIWLPEGSEQVVSNFRHRLLFLLDESEALFSVNQYDKCSPFQDIKTIELVTAQPCLPTKGQLNAIALVKKVACGQNRKPLVITADRGRGKSSALALAVAELMHEAHTPMHVVITAPHRMAVNVFFHHLTHATEQGKLSGDTFKWREHQVVFLPIDEVLKNKPDVSLCLVDEAAGIPVYLLEQLIQRYHRLVFSSTIHGYEGAGKGFTSKFLPILKKRCKSIKQCHLEQPIRWAEHDPLETFVFNTCLLNADYNEHWLNELTKAQLSAVNYQKVTGSQLVQNELVLTQVFAILVTAHYQTKPSDLKRLLDDEAIAVHMLTYDGQPVAVALTVTEGVIEPKLKADVIAGKRRLKGQLIPQVIAQQLLHKEALDFNYQRVMRIAVPPLIQGEGLGSTLLAQIQQNAACDNVDFIGTSFAASVQVVDFWQKCSYQAAKLGFAKDASSGEHSLVMLKPMNSLAAKFSTELSEEFYQELLSWLKDEFNHLDYALVAKLISMAPAEFFPELDLREREKLAAFKHNQHFYAIAKNAMAKWLCRQLIGTKSNQEAYFPLIAKCLMLHCDKQVVEHFNYSGKKDLYRSLQQIIDC